MADSIVIAVTMLPLLLVAVLVGRASVAREVFYVPDWSWQEEFGEDAANTLFVSSSSRAGLANTLAAEADD